MAWLKKKSDPISDRARDLNAEIAALEEEIRRLDTQVQGQTHPRLRSTAVPHGLTITHVGESNGTSSHGLSREPVFEEVDQNLLTTREEPAVTPEHFNDLGARKYDFPALLQRLRGWFQGPTASNPKLISYLAAGGIQGLRPLRHEKRVARNRLIFLVIFLLLILLGIVSLFVRR